MRPGGSAVSPGPSVAGSSVASRTAASDSEQGPHGSATAPVVESALLSSSPEHPEMASPVSANRAATPAVVRRILVAASSHLASAGYSPYLDFPPVERFDGRCQDDASCGTGCARSSPPCERMSQGDGTIRFSGISVRSPTRAPSRPGMCDEGKENAVSAFQRVRHASAPGPSGCRWCGRARGQHGMYFTPSVGNHLFTEPTAQQRLARMRARRTQAA